MYLLQIKKNLPIDDTDTEAKDIPAFNNILKHDKGGETLLKVLAFYCDWLSPFRYIINDENRLQAVLKNFFGKHKHSFTKTQEWSDGVDTYYFLQKDADRIMLRNLERYYDTLTEKIDKYSSQEANDIDAEIENIERVQSYTRKAMSLRNEIRTLKDAVNNSRSNINANVKKQLCFLEERALRNRALESNI